MKKITLLLLLLFVSLSGYSQLFPAEGFESTAGPENPPSTDWYLGSGTWAVFDNDAASLITTTKRWGINSVAANVHQGLNAAFMDRDNIGAGNTAEDFLATPLVFVPTNGELHFFARTFASGQQGTIFQIRVAPSTANQNDPSAYTTIQTYTEAQLSTNFNEYEEKVVNLGAFYANQSIYIAFVQVWTQPTTALGGDRWLLDDVSVVEKCLDPTNLTFSGVTSFGATLNWTNTSGATSWEIEIVPASGTPTGTGVVYNGLPPYVATGLQPNTPYKFYVRALCSQSSSQWVGPSANFTTLVAPPVCGGNFVDTGGIAGNYANNANNTTTISPVNPGEVVTVTFTSFNTEANNDVLKVYNGSVSPANLIGSYSGTTLPPAITSSAANGSLVFVFTSNASVTAAGWASNITCGPPVACPKLIALNTSALLSNSVTLGWTATGSATTWQVLALPCAAPAPTASTTGWVSTTDNPYNITGLTPGTCYNLYVRSDCATDGVGEWAGPISVTTPAAPPICGGNYVDGGGLTGNYANNITAAAGTQVISPITPGDVVTVTFTSFNTELNNDVMKVYNGNNTLPANLIGTFSGTTLPPVFTSTAADGSLTFVFTSNATVNAAGWVANITCGPPPATCTAPIALTTSALVANSVSLGWTATNSATTWQVIALPCAAPAPTASTTGWVTATTNPFTVTGLTATTCYKLYVRTDCSATSGGVSDWSLPVTINTPCSSYTVPFQEGFNTGSPSEQCWTVLNVNGDADAWDMNYATNPYEGDQAAMLYTDFNNGANNDWLISPQIILTGNQRLKFHYRVQSAAEPNEFRVMLSTNTSNPADFTQTLVPLTTYSNTTYIEKRVNLSAYNQPVYIAWQVPPGSIDGWRVYIDNVIVENLPSCPEPESVVATNVTSNSVSLSWTNGNSETAWEVLALPCLSPAPAANATGYVPAGTNPFTLTGLTPNTCYDIYVRAVCSSTDKSIWSIVPVTVNTLCLPFTVPFQEGFNSNSTTQSCWTVLNVNNDTDKWDMDYATNPYEGDQCAMLYTDGNAGNNNDWLISPTITLNGNQRLRYRYRVQSANEPNDFRVMYSTTGTSPASFNANPPLVALTSYSNTTYVEKIVNLTNISGDTNIGFHVPQGGLDGWRLYIDKVVVENIPTCLPPINLTVSNIEATSALLGWTDTNSPTPATQWEVIFVPQGDPEPLPSAVGQIVSFNPALMTGLAPGTAYTYYVRAVCSSTDKSEWSLGANFTTLIINDNCSGAVFAPVNQSQICQQTTPGTISGATASTGVPAACIGTADDDVWFQFVASNPYLTVSLLNVVGSTTNLNFAVYSGQCNSLTQVYCSTANTLYGVVNGLTLGQTYYIRVYSNANTAQTVNFNLCISTPSSCLSATSACQNLQYPNIQGITNQPAIGCLSDPRNPSYYTINVTQTGPINLLLTQSTTLGGTPNLDVDYAAWGPFASQGAACAAIGNPPTLAPGIGVPVTTTTGCSFSAASTETLNIANAVAGQVYVILITNYANTPGFISLTQQNVNAPGAGTYECCPDAFFKYTPATYCKGSNTNPIPTIDSGSLAGTFSLAPSSPTGLVFANTATGEVDLAASAPGIYSILNTVAASTTTNCPQAQRGYTIKIEAPLTASISYGPTNYTTFCKSITTLQPVTITGTTGGSFSVTPNGGLYINTTTGDINPSLSQPGVYTISYGIPSSTCTGTNPSTTVEIFGLPNIPNQSPITRCDSYTLPALPEGNYYSTSQLNGPATAPLDITVPITSSQMVYAYAITSNGCPLEKSFMVTINSVPTPTFNVTQSSCTSSTGSITVTSPVSTSGNTPTDLFISEVTDSNWGSLSYVELFNGTNATINLSTYSIKTANNGGAYSFTLPLNNVNLTSGSTYVIALGNDSACTTSGGNGSLAAQNNASGSVNFAANGHDHIALFKGSTQIDSWGVFGSNNWAPASVGTEGADFRRKNTASSLPNTVYNNSDWDVYDYLGSGSNANCANNDYSNIGVYSLTISNYQYSLDNGPFQSGVTFSNLAAGPHVLVVKDLLTTCTSAPITINVDAPGSGTITSLTPNTPICSGGNAVFDIVGTPNATVTYTINGGSNQTVVLDATGNATVTVNSVTVDTVIALNQISTASCTVGISNTATVQVLSSVVFGTLTATTPVCSGGDAVFTLTGTANATVTYTINGGANQTVVLDATGAGSVTITGVTADTTILLNNISLGSCSTTLTDSATVTVLPNPALVSLTANTPICSGDNAVFNLVGTANATVTYTIDGGANQTVVLDASGNGSVTITGVTANTTMTLSQITLSSCSTALTNTATVVVVTNPSITTLTAATPICSGSNAVFTLTGTANTTVTYTINGGANQTVVLDASGNGSVTVTGVTVDTTILLSQISIGSCVSTLTNTATVVVLPNPTLATLTSITPICSGGDAEFALTGTPNATVTYSINGGANQTVVLDATGAGSVTITGVTADTTMTLSQISLATCITPLTNTATVVLSLPVQILLSGGCQGQFYNLTASPVSNSFDPQTVTYEWYNDLGIMIGTTQTITVTQAGNYYVIITNGGCASQSAPFKVDSTICVIQKGISADNDGLNDYFDLSGYNVKRLTIFNRYGMKVYTKDNYVKEWMGQSDKGDELPDATYYYVIERTTGENVTGWIYINRVK